MPLGLGSAELRTPSLACLGLAAVRSAFEASASSVGLWSRVLQARQTHGTVPTGDQRRGRFAGFNACRRYAVSPCSVLLAGSLIQTRRPGPCRLHRPSSDESVHSKHCSPPCQFSTTPVWASAVPPFGHVFEDDRWRDRGVAPDACDIGSLVQQQGPPRLEPEFDEQRLFHCSGCAQLRIPSKSVAFATLHQPSRRLGSAHGRF